MQQTILIIGCSSGFGRCTALYLAAPGWHVYATVRQEADRASLMAEAMLQVSKVDIAKSSIVIL